MTLFTAILGGLVCGYFFGFGPKALAVLLALWVAVLLFQTFIALDPVDVPPEAWEYVPVQVFIFLVGVVAIWIGTKLRYRFHGQPSI